MKENNITSKIANLIEILETKKEELNVYLKKNEESKIVAKKKWSKINKTKDDIEDEEKKAYLKRGRYLIFCILIYAVTSTILTGGLNGLVIIPSLLALVVGQIINIFIETDRVENRHREIKNAKADYDNLKYDNEEAKSLLGTINFLLEIYNSKAKENESVLYEYYKYTSKIYESMINVDIDYESQKEPIANNSGLRIVNSRKKYSASSRVLSIPKL